MHPRPETGLPFGLLLTLLPSLLAAQSPTPEHDLDAQPSSTLLVMLRSSRVTLDRASDLADVLQTRATRDRLQAHRVLRDHVLRRAKAHDKLEQRALKQLEHAARTAQPQNLGRKGSAEVETLRRDALAVTHTTDLSKARIHDDIDPRIASLEQLLLPALVDVLAADRELDGALEQLRSSLDELRSWRALCLAALAGLELHDAVDKHLRKYPSPVDPGGREQLEQRLAAARFTGLEMSPADRKALEHNAGLRAETAEQEFLGTLELNRLRYLLGLPLVRIDPKLGDAARDHSRDMSTLGFFSHTSPVDGKRTFGMRAARFGTTASAENIAAGQATGHGAIEAWWYSPGHHKNMLANHRRTGLGQHDHLWTQLFGG